MDYAKLLEDSYQKFVPTRATHATRLNFLSECLFGFNTQGDDSASELMALMAVGVMKSIESGSLSPKHMPQDVYFGHIVMTHMPFFRDKLDWGVNVDDPITWRTNTERDTVEVPVRGFVYDGHSVPGDLCFYLDEWAAFVREVIAFASKKDSGWACYEAEPVLLVDPRALTGGKEI